MLNRSPFRALLFLLPILLMQATLIGCAASGGGGSLRTVSLTPDHAELRGQFTTAIYAVNNESVASFYLSDIPVQQLLSGRYERGQIIHVEMLWLPRAGSTPIERTAANITVRKVVIVDGQAGVYGGMGFARPRGEPGANRLAVSIFEATLNLIDASPDFNDLLTPAILEGSFTAERDDRLTERIRYATSQHLTNLLGRVRYVEATAPSSTTIP